MKIHDNFYKGSISLGAAALTVAGVTVLTFIACLILNNFHVGNSHIVKTLQSVSFATSLGSQGFLLLMGGIVGAVFAASGFKQPKFLQEDPEPKAHRQEEQAPKIESKE